MPTYLVHGFRWQRANIRIHIILQDLEDAAAEWVVAPATSLTLLNSFYKLYDFLPPSHPPKPTYPAPVPFPVVPIDVSIPANFPPPPPIPDDDNSNGNGNYAHHDDFGPPRKTLTKKSTRSMVSLRSIARRQKSQTFTPSPNNNNNHHNIGNGNSGGHHASLEPPRPPTAPRPSTARQAPPSRHSHSNSLRGAKKQQQQRPAFNDWSAIKLLEQYDPSDMYSVSQPYAYVADHVVEVTLGASLAEEMGKYEAKTRSEEMMPDSPVSADAPDMHLPNGEGGNDNNGHPSSSGSSGVNGMSSAARKGRPGWFEKLRDGLQSGCDIGWFVVVCGDEERVPPSIDLIRTKHSGRPSMTSDGSLSVKMQRQGGFRGLFRRKIVVEE